MLKWVAGAFYQKYRQESKQFVEDTFLPNLFADVTGAPFALALGPLADGLYTFKQDSVIAARRAARRLRAVRPQASSTNSR